MLYRANMAMKTTQQVVVEPGRLAAIAVENGHDASYDDEGAEEYDEDDGYEGDEHDDEEYEYEHAARLNDSRQARGVRPPLRQSGPPRASADSLAQVPVRGHCKGRHRGKCPISVAQKDASYDRRAAERNGTRCNYKDPTYIDVICNGQYHLSRHHDQM